MKNKQTRGRKFYNGNEQGKQPTSNAAKRSVNQLIRRWRKLGAKETYFSLTKVMSDSTFENLKASLSSFKIK